MEKRETKSPIKNLPVRMPGQSLREQIDDVFDDQVLPWLVGALVGVVLAGMEWSRYYKKIPPAPVLYTIVALCVIAVATWKIRKALRTVRTLRLGRLGEEAVGQFLDEKLRPLGCQVLHDLPADGFNLDHVVVGPTGVFCIETKTHSKPAKGASSVKYDGDKVTVDGFTPDRDPLIQGKAEARWLVDILEQSTGRRFFVQPIILYPGWFVEPMPPNASIWVLNENAVPTFIKNARNSLSPEDISLITFHLKRYVISFDKQKKTS